MLWHLVPVLRGDQPRSHGLLRELPGRALGIEPLGAIPVDGRRANAVSRGIERRIDDPRGAVGNFEREELRHALMIPLTQR